MIKEIDFSQEMAWRCASCDKALELTQVTVTYMNNSFTTEMPCCPQCGQVVVSEELAMGKMAEVEKILEDK